MKKYLKFALTILIFLLADFFAIIPVLLFNINLDSIDAKTEIILSIFSNLILVIILCLMYKNELKEMFLDFKNNFKKCFNIGYKYWMIGLIFMAISNIILSTIFKSDKATNEEIVQQTIMTFPILSLFLTSIMAPITEEIVFRLNFRKVINNDILYVLLAGISFGFIHVLFTSSTLGEYLYFIPYSCLGIALALMYVKSKNVFTPIFMHFSHNFIFTTISIIGYLL